MKIKSLLIVAMCAISFGAYAQTVMFYENFANNGWHNSSLASAAGNGELTANYNAAIAAYKPASGNFYFAETFYVHGDWGIPAPSFSGASAGSYLHIGEGGDAGTFPKFTIQVNTSSKAYATLSYSHGLRAWGENGTETSSVKWSYSFDNSTWIEMPKADAIISKSGDWDLVEHIENLGGKDVVYLKIESVNGSALLDDFRVTGYDAIPVFKSKLKAAITAAENFSLSVTSDPAYCPANVADFIAVAIPAAQAVADDDDATQEEVDAAVTALGNAETALKATALDFTAANEAIAGVDAFTATYLYANGEAALKTAFDDASIALQIMVLTGSVGSNCATQAQLDAAVGALATAKAALEAKALNFEDANAAVTAAETFKTTEAYTIWSADATSAFDQALAALKAVIAANGVVESKIISATDLAAYVTALENAQQTLIGVDGTAIEGISITSSQIILPAAADVQIYSASGALILSIYADQVNIAGLPAGVYIVKANGASVSFVK